MHKQRGTSRRNFGALVVLVVLVAAAALGSGDGASAAKNDGGRPRPDYGSKELFKAECELLGGVFTEALGYTYCHHNSGTVVCDANGNNCTSHSTSGRRPPGGANSYDGSINDVTTVVDEPDTPQNNAKQGKAKKHRHGGKGRK
jgi:hypothetical protein